MKLFVIILFFFINNITYSFPSEQNSISNFFKSEPGKILPDVPFYNAKGEKLILDQFDGKIILLHFWATWCADCAKGIKSLDELQKKFMKLPIKIIPLSVDFKDVDTITNYYKSNNINYLNIYKDNKRSLYSAFSSHGLPITVIINEKGEMLGYFKGNVNWENEWLKNWLVALTKNIKFKYKEDQDSKEILEKKMKQ